MAGHGALVLFNLSGWIWRRTRRAHLALLGLTGLCWFAVGPWYGGLGYCPLTDWHYAVLARLGETDLPRSYIVYCIRRFLALEADARLTDGVVLACYLVALMLSAWRNWRDWRRRY